MQSDLDFTAPGGCQCSGHLFPMKVIFLPSLSWVFLPLPPCISHYTDLFAKDMHSAE